MHTPRFLALLLLFLSAPAANAEEALGLVTGPKTGTYIAIGRDIAAVARQSGLHVDVKTSDGSIDNIRRINSNENASIGIVQSDVLGFMARSHNPETIRMGEHLRMILPLYREEVHVLARGGIQNFSGLEGKKVVIGEDGSGHLLTSINLFAMTGVTPAELIRKSPPEGLLELLDGKVDAVIFVGGKPVRLFKNLESLTGSNHSKYQELLSNLHFLALKEPRMLEEYQVGEITHNDYAFVKDPVPTIAVTAVLVDYDFSDHARKHEVRCRQVARLAEAIRQNIPLLQSRGHPKWKEVKLDESLPIWKQDSCAWPQGQQPEASGKALGSDLIDVIKKQP